MNEISSYDRHDEDTTIHRIINYPFNPDRLKQLIQEDIRTTNAPALLLYNSSNLKEYDFNNSPRYKCQIEIKYFFKTTGIYVSTIEITKEALCSIFSQNDVDDFVSNYYNKLNPIAKTIYNYINEAITETGKFTKLKDSFWSVAPISAVLKSKRIAVLTYPNKIKARIDRYYFNELDESFGLDCLEQRKALCKKETEEIENDEILKCDLGQSGTRIEIRNVVWKNKPHALTKRTYNPMFEKTVQEKIFSFVLDDSNIHASNGTSVCSIEYIKGTTDIKYDESSRRYFIYIGDDKTEDYCIIIDLDDWPEFERKLRNALGEEADAILLRAFI